jgi:primosomal protein N' (replication factor Y)
MIDTAPSTHSSEKSKTPLWHADVAPLAALPLTGNQTFTYASEEELLPGDLVSIPMANRTLAGVVFSVRDMRVGSHPKLPFRVRRIFSMTQKGFLTPKQITLALWISERTYTPLGRCLVHFAPKIAASKTIDGTLPRSCARTSAARIRLTEEQRFAIDTIAQSRARAFSLFGPSSSGKTEVYIRAIKQRFTVNPQEQALVLVPELTLLPQETQRYGEVFGDDALAVLHSRLAPGVFFETWQRIASGRARVIIGTRQALFAPFAKLGLVIVDEEQDDAYKQRDMSPRYDGRSVAEKLAELHNASVVFGSATPSIERFHRAQRGDIGLLTLSSLRHQPKYSIELVNMRFEHASKNRSSLSRILVEAIALAIKQKRQTILFVNRQGSSAFSVCTACSSIVRCATCQRALVYDDTLGAHRCLHCSFKGSLFQECASCKGVAFKHIGIGTQKVEREILKQFPFAATARIDRQTMQKKGAQEDVFHRFQNGAIDVLVGTQMATKGWDLPNVALVGIIDADSLFAFPDFKTDEIAFGHILQAAGRTARVGSSFEGKVFVQTFYPENPTLQKVLVKDFPAFYRETIAEREPLFYPPFGSIVRVLVSDKDAKKTDREIKKIHAQLSRIVSENVLLHRTIRISEPQAPLIDTIRFKHRRHLIIRSGLCEWPDALAIFFKKISKNCTIDVDPVSIV